MKCKKCQSERLSLVKTGPHHKAVCLDCLAFNGFIKKSDQAAFNAAHQQIEPPKAVEAEPTKHRSICVLGPRPSGLLGGWKGDRSQIRAKLTAILERAKNKGFTVINSGAAQGIDTYAANIAMKLGYKARFFVPCTDQTAKWDDVSQNLYDLMLSKGEVIHVTGVPYKEDAQCMEKRNHSMIDDSDIVVAVENIRPGGTANAIKYASGRKPLLIINQENLSERWIMPSKHGEI